MIKIRLLIRVTAFKITIVGIVGFVKAKDTLFIILNGFSVFVMDCLLFSFTNKLVKLLQSCLKRIVGKT